VYNCLRKDIFNTYTIINHHLPTICEGEAWEEEGGGGIVGEGEEYDPGHWHPYSHHHS
jgi:hypothetical protein